MIDPRKDASKQADDERSPQEAERLREATLKKLLGTPPKRHDEMIADRQSKTGKRKPAK